MELAFLQIGTQEMFVIVVAILLLFGGKKLPELARGLGRGIREFKDASEGIKKEIADQINNFEKDLDVTAQDKQEQTQQYTSVEPTGSETDTEDAQQDQSEKKFPQFSTPENTYQHDPGAHPVDDTEYYKYGYNDHFATDDINDSEEPPAKSGNDGNKPSEPA